MKEERKKQSSFQKKKEAELVLNSSGIWISRTEAVFGYHSKNFAKKEFYMHRVLNVVYL